jgi:hypothetical protein
LSKSIETLIADIYSQVQQKGNWFSGGLVQEFSREVGARLEEQFGRTQGAPTLRLSQMGPRCPKALWHSIHTPDLAEPLQPWAEVKFSFGHILEALAIALAKASGHHVCGEQDAVYVDGITGHRDCVIDGCIVDVKSCSSRSYQKFKDKSLGQNDSFGYLDQLDGYLVGSLEDPLVTVKDRGYLLAIHKELGHMCLYEHILREKSIRARISDYRRIVSSEQAPPCTCGTVADGKSGNIRLDTRASYNSYKFSCFPNLRTFIYANGPVYLTKVERVPDVPEINKEGKLIAAFRSR